MIKADAAERSRISAMVAHARQTGLIQRWRRLDRRLAQAPIIIGAFATAAVLAALYGPGPRQATATQPSLSPSGGMIVDMRNEEAIPTEDETAARERARRKIAETLARQAAEAAASARSETPTSQIPFAAPTLNADAHAPDLEKLAIKAAEATRIGDIAGARLLLEHAAAVGDTTAIYRLAETYDPRVLAKLHVRGMTGDASKAQTLYKQALAKGVARAQAKLDPLGE